MAAVNPLIHCKTSYGKYVAEGITKLSTVYEVKLTSSEFSVDNCKNDTKIEEKKEILEDVDILNQLENLKIIDDKLLKEVNSENHCKIAELNQKIKDVESKCSHVDDKFIDKVPWLNNYNKNNKEECFENDPLSEEYHDNEELLTERGPVLQSCVENSRFDPYNVSGSLHGKVRNYHNTSGGSCVIENSSSVLPEPLFDKEVPLSPENNLKNRKQNFFHKNGGEVLINSSISLIDITQLGASSNLGSSPAHSPFSNYSSPQSDAYRSPSSVNHMVPASPLTCASSPESLYRSNSPSESVIMHCSSPFGNMLPDIPKPEYIKLSDSVGNIFDIENSEMPPDVVEFILEKTDDNNSLSPMNSSLQSQFQSKMEEFSELYTDYQIEREFDSDSSKSVNNEVFNRSPCSPENILGKNQALIGGNFQESSSNLNLNNSSEDCIVAYDEIKKNSLSNNNTANQVVPDLDNIPLTVIEMSAANGKGELPTSKSSRQLPGSKNRHSSQPRKIRTSSGNSSTSLSPTPSNGGTSPIVPLLFPLPNSSSQQLIIISVASPSQPNNVLKPPNFVAIAPKPVAVKTYEEDNTPKVSTEIAEGSETTYKKIMHDILEKYPKTERLNKHRNLSRKSEEEIGKVDDDGDSCLHITICNNWIVEAVYIIDRFKNSDNLDINIKNKRGETPLSCAVSESTEPGIVKLLLESGADLNVCKKISGNSLLHVIALKGNSCMAEIICQNSSVNKNAFNNQGVTPLMLAIQSHGNKIKTEDGEVECNNLPVIKLLLKNGASVNLPNRKDGKTAVHYAVEKMNTSILELLCQYCPDAVNKKTFSDVSPSMLALSLRDCDPVIQEKIIQILFKYGGNDNTIEKKLKALLQSRIQRNH